MHISQKNTNFACNFNHYVQNNTIMKTPYEYRAQAREALQEHWGDAAIVSAIIFAFTLIISTPSIIGAVNQSESGGSFTTLLSVLVLPLQYAFYIALLERTRSNTEGLLQFTWDYIKKEAYAKMRFLVAGLLIIVLSTLLGIITFGIGAIILEYAYSMVPYILHDYPELSPREAMKISREMMSGQKWNLFVLDFSFIGWILLAILTCGIGTLFVVPYMQTARAAFYDDLKAATIVDDTENTIEETTAEEVE